MKRWNSNVYNITAKGKRIWKLLAKRKQFQIKINHLEEQINA